MPNPTDAGYVAITKHVAKWIIKNLGRIVEDAYDGDETGYLDRMNPELSETMWISEVVRFVNTVRAVLENNLNTGLPLELTAQILDAALNNDEDT